jgi:DNA segregation ATPase FtsK/SpoIIIE, S-DNA-T family
MSQILALVFILAILMLAVRVAWALYRFARMGPQARRHVPLALWAKARWRWFCRSQRLAYLDQHRRRWAPVPHHIGTAVRVRKPADDGTARLRYPKARFRSDQYGITATVRAIPLSGSRQDFQDVSDYLADHWRCVRVQVSQPKPGRITLRGLRTDPLTEPLSASVLPAFDGRHVSLGRDELAVMRSADLANLSGSAWSGNPGTGKTEGGLSLAVQLAPSPLVDMWILDGGACDWAPFADGAAGYVGDDLAAAEDMLRVLDTLMCDRRRNLQAVRGSRNGWIRGPDENYRLQWVLVEEAPFYLDDLAVRGDRVKEGHVRACRGLLAGLLRRGRAPLFHTSLIAQKGTGTGGLPPDLRDLCGLRWSFGVATSQAAAAILGDDIHQYDTMSPTLLQGSDHVGVASVLLRTGTSPYTLVKFPHVGQARADRVAAVLASRAPGSTAHLCHAPGCRTPSSHPQMTGVTS